MRLSVRLCALAFALVAPATAVHAQTAQNDCPRVAPATTADCDGVRRAAFDYIEGFYEYDSTKLVRSIRPEVYKYGFWRARDSTKSVGERMSWEEILKYARDGRAANRRVPPTVVKRVELLEVQNETAAAKVTAFWGTDYVLVGKFDGRWMISHVLWQSPPKPGS